MDARSLLLLVSFACALPAGLVLIGAIAHRPGGARKLRRYGRPIALGAALLWAGLALDDRLAASGPSLVGVLAPFVFLLRSVAFAIGRSGAEPSRS